jgi:hypothetical protein
MQCATYCLKPLSSRPGKLEFAAFTRYEALPCNECQEALPPGLHETKLIRGLSRWRERRGLFLKKLYITSAGQRSHPDQDR